MVHDLTSSIYAASARTRVPAFLVDASSVLGAIRADHAFGSTCRGRTDIVRQAGAHSVPVHLAALAERPARRRGARVFGGRRS